MLCQWQIHVAATPDYFPYINKHFKIWWREKLSLMQLPRHFPPTRRNLAFPSRGLLPLFRENFDRTGPSTPGSKSQARPRMGPGGARSKAAHPGWLNGNSLLGPALTTALLQLGCRFQTAAQIAGHGSHPRSRSRWLLGPPAAPSATSPLPRAAGHATAPRRRPHGKRACLAQEARTLESWGHHCWGPDYLAIHSTAHGSPRLSSAMFALLPANSGWSRPRGASGTCSCAWLGLAGAALHLAQL